MAPGPDAARAPALASGVLQGGKNPAAFRHSSQWGRRTRRFDRGIWKHPSCRRALTSMTTELAGKTALITGAGRGGGRSPARREPRRRPARDGCPPGGGGVGEVPVAASSDRGWHGVPAAPGLDPDSARWLQALADDGPRRESALAELYAMLLRAARREAARRGPRVQITGPELEDLACQAAGDALLAITQKAGQFGAKAGSPPGRTSSSSWRYRPRWGAISGATRPGPWMPRAGTGCRTGSFRPAQESEWRDLLAAVRRAVDTELTPRQREVFVAVALNDVPADALAIKLGSNRNALYKMMFDARRKLRAALVADGYLPDAESRRS